jgi:hypothetical protein
MFMNMKNKRGKKQLGNFCCIFRAEVTESHEIIDLGLSLQDFTYLNAAYEDMIYIYIYLTAVGLTPGGSSTSHIYTQTVHLHTTVRIIQR